MGHYGIGHLTAVTILAELGDARRFSSSRDAVRYSGLDITVHQSDQRRAPGHLSRQGPPALRWALYEAAQSAPPAQQPRPRLLHPGGRAARAATAPAWPSRASCSNAATTPCANSATRHCNPPDPGPGLRAQPSLTPMHRGRLPASSCRHARVDGLQRPSGRTASPSGITPSTIMSPTGRTARSRTEIRLGACAHHTHDLQRAHGPPDRPGSCNSPHHSGPALDTDRLHRYGRATEAPIGPTASHPVHRHDVDDARAVGRTELGVVAIALRHTRH